MADPRFRSSRPDRNLRWGIELRHVPSTDIASLERLCRRYERPLLRRIRLMMGVQARRVAESSDFLNETFLQTARALEKKGSLEEKALLRWMTEVARNRIRDAVRRKHERALSEFSDSLSLAQRVDDGQPSPSSAVGGREALHRLAEGLESMKPGEREIIELRHFEALGFREIGERLGKSENAAQLLHARALLKLNRKLHLAGDDAGV